MTHLRENIEAGIRLLDTNVPDWRERVNLQVLDMVSVRLCVLGQVYHQPGDSWFMNGFDRGRVSLGVYDEPWEYGFEPLETADQEVPSRADYASLTEMWKEYLS